MTDDQTLLLAPYKSPWNQTPPIPGARIVRAGCGHRAWLSPQGETAYATIPSVCLECSTPVLADSTAHLVPGAIAAVLDAAPDQADQVREVVDRLGLKEIDE